jgi:predicted RNA-binding Zn ribbon-like protein
MMLEEVSTMATQPKEAPGDLAVVREFINTRDIDHGLEQFGTPEEVVAWLADHDLIDRDAVARPGDVRRAALFREALRQLLLSNNDGRPVPRDAARTLDDVAARARLRLRVDAGGSARLETEGKSVDAALGRLLVIVYRAMENDTWLRLKACREDTCQWAFYDHSKNRSGHWCSMEVCGSRHKARQYRERRKSG